MDVKETLTTKIGPLPAIAWAGIAGGGYVVFRYIKARNQPAASADLGYGEADISQSAPGPWGTGSGANPSSVVNPSNTPTSASQTNVDWGTMAENWAIAMGFNPTDVATALGSYLYGTNQQLNTTQTSILQSVLRQFGSPPEGVIIPPPTTQPPPIPTQPPPPPPPPAPPSPFNPFPTRDNSGVGKYTWYDSLGRQFRSDNPPPVGSFDSPPGPGNPFYGQHTM